jgi:hypothetical protein
MKANLPVDGQKFCAACDKMLPVAAFYPDKNTLSGLGSRCAECARKKARERYYREHDKVMAAEALRRKKPEHREKNRVYRKQSDVRHPQRAKARQLLNNAVRDGRIERLPCHKCGDPKSQGHHEDYSKPLDVEWICAPCHAKEHRTSPEGLADLAVAR